MTRKISKFAAILAAAVLIIGLVLIISPSEAHAAYGYPEPEDIYIDVDYNDSFHFTSTKTYYDSGTHVFSSNGSFTAYYVKSEGKLVLWGYTGGGIRVENSRGKQLTIYLVGDNTINSTQKVGLEAEGVRLIITSQEEGGLTHEPPRLTINHNYQNHGIDGVGLANEYTETHEADIIISGTAEVFVNSRAYTVDSGIYTLGKLIIQDSASVEVNAEFGDQGTASTHSEAVYAGKGVSISTSGRVNFSVAARDNWVGKHTGYAVYIKSGSFSLSPGAEYVALSGVGENVKQCNITIPTMSLSSTGYHDSTTTKLSYFTRYFRSDIPIDDGIYVNAFFFPDPTFRAFVRSQVDPERSGFALFDELYSVDGIELDDPAGINAKYADAYSLAGIEYLPKITYLYWPNGKLMYLDVSSNTELVVLDVTRNYLVKLDTSKLTKLKRLYCGNNLLNSVWTGNNTDLETFDCSNDQDFDNMNYIYYPDVSNNTKLKTFYCYGNSVKSVKLGSNSNLTWFWCYDYYEPLDVLDISGCPKLVDCYLNYDDKDTMPQYFVEYYKSLDSGNADMRINGSTIIAYKTSTTNSYIMSYNAELAGDLFFNTFIVPSWNVLNETGMKFEFSYVDASNRSNPKTVTKNIIVKDAPTNTNNGYTRRVVTSKFFIAQLHDEVKLRIKNSSGTYQALERKFGNAFADVSNGAINTPWDYLQGRIENSSDPNMVKLAEALQYYGTAAQLYFNYKTSQLSPEEIHDLEAATSASSVMTGLASHAAVETGSIPAGITKITSNLVVEDDHSLVYHFYLDGSKPISNYTFYIDYADGNGYKKVTPVKEADNKYCIQVEGIPSGYLSRTYKFKVTGSGSTREIKASALSYAYGRVMNSTNPNMVRMAKALYLYSRAADAYFHTGN